MAQRFFKKELVNKPILMDGKPVYFAPIPGNTGLLVVDTDRSPELLEFLVAKIGVKGIVEVTKDEYENLKKKRAHEEASRPSKPRRNVLRPFAVATSPFQNDTQQQESQSANPVEGDTDGIAAAPPPPPPNVMDSGWSPEVSEKTGSKPSEQAVAASKPDPAPKPPPSDSPKPKGKPKVSKPASRAIKSNAAEIAAKRGK